MSADLTGAMLVMSLAAVVVAFAMGLQFGWLAKHWHQTLTEWRNRERVDG